MVGRSQLVEHFLDGLRKAGLDVATPSGGTRPAPNVPTNYAPDQSAHDTVGFQSANEPLGLSFHAQTCSS